MNGLLEKKTIAVDLTELETLVGMGKLSSGDALRLSPEFVNNRLYLAATARESEVADIKNATGTFEIAASDLIPLCLLARELAWTTDKIKNVYPAMYQVSALLAARGRGES